MAAQSPLTRFFGVPGASGAAKQATSPKTPAPTAAAKAQETPPSATEASGGRKRGPKAKAEAADAKKPRRQGSLSFGGGAASQGEAAPAPDAAPAASAEAGDEKMPDAEQPGLAPAEVPAVPTPMASASGSADAPSDLRATLAREAGRAGGLPAFTAEIFHHFAAGERQYSWPSWLRPENLRDRDGRKPSDPMFNQSTLWVPDEKTAKDEGHGTPMLQQYWKLKSHHFDKIALFKVGKFYELFYYDAFISQRECGLKWMSVSKPHVGFPEMAKHTYAKMLVDAGYKVVVVEQVERVAEQQQRKDKGSDGPKCVERDACEVFTKGTLVDPELLGGAGARYMMYLHFDEAHASHGAAVAGAGRGGTNFSACLLDCATSQVYLCRSKDGVDRNALRTLMAQVQPSEVVYSQENLPTEVLTLVRRLPCRPQLSPVRAAPSLMAARDRLNKYRTQHPGKLPPSVEELLKAEESNVVAAAAAIDYLDAVMLGSRVLPFATWDTLPDLAGAPEGASASSTVGRRMVLDATALSALEVLETLEGGYKGSLLEFLNHTSTDFGFRMLKQWLCAPLLDVGEIRKRSEAVNFLIDNSDVAQRLRSGLKQVPVDLERATSRVWGFALQAERHAVMYDDVTAKRLGDFKELLTAYQQCIRLLAASFADGRTVPERLGQVTRSGKDGCFPDLQGVIARLSNSVVEAPSQKSGKVKYQPAAGADAAHDGVCKQIKANLAKLDQELAGLKAKFPKTEFAFMHRMPGYRYEVECDDKAIPQTFLATVDVTYRSKSKVRFHTQRIKDLVAELDMLENKREDCLFPFLSRLFKEFHTHQAQFRAAVRCLAELDAMLSLANVSRGLTGASCQAELVELQGEEMGTLELKGCRHPVAAAKMRSGFVPNDTVLNAGDVPGVLVVTGPNMGGKSTVLRQTCVAVIMAQLGCRVNAQSCRLSPVDRIFTRIGSYDTILEGKSTLLTELEETAAILAHGTRRSLAVLDELGRGTSTFDGAAIASAVLNELIGHVKCLVLFATHYHPVSKEAALSPSVAPYHMAAEVDAATNAMTFLYRFLPGLCPASHGHHVARLAGLPGKVLEEALTRSAEFERGGRVASGPGLSHAGGEVARLAGLKNEEALRAWFREHQRASGVTA